MDSLVYLPKADSFLFFQERAQKMSSSGSDLKASTAFDEIKKRAVSQPELIKQVGAIIVFDITKDGKVQQTWSEYDGKVRLL